MKSGPPPGPWGLSSSDGEARRHQVIIAQASLAFDQVLPDGEPMGLIDIRVGGAAVETGGPLAVISEVSLRRLEGLPRLGDAHEFAVIITAELGCEQLLGELLEVIGMAGLVFAVQDGHRPVNSAWIVAIGVHRLEQ